RITGAVEGAAGAMAARPAHASRPRGPASRVPRSVCRRRIRRRSIHPSGHFPEERSMRSWRSLPLTLLLLALAPGAVWAQQATRTEPVVALRDNTPGVHAFTNARIVVAPGRVLERATLVVRNGLVEAVGANVEAPADARVWDMSGRTLYPGFIDAHADLALGLAPEDDQRDPGPVHWNPQVRAYFSAAGDFRDAEDRRSALRAQGFTAVNAVPQLGIFRGRTAVISLGDGTASERVLRPNVAQALAFRGSSDL